MPLNGILLARDIKATSICEEAGSNITKLKCMKHLTGCSCGIELLLEQLVGVTPDPALPPVGKFQ